MKTIFKIISTTAFAILFVVFVWLTRQNFMSNQHMTALVVVLIMVGLFSIWMINKNGNNKERAV